MRRGMNAPTLTILLQRAAVGSSLPAATTLSTLPWFIRFSLADVFTQAQRGELVALRCAEKLFDMETDPDARAFALTQVRDEQSHLGFFTSALSQLKVERPVLEPLGALFDLAQTQNDLPSLLLANHLIVETLAHDVFGEVATQFTRLAGKRWLPPTWRRAFAELSVRMLGISRDESRHVAFGVIRLATVRRALEPEARQQLDTQAQGWVDALESTLSALPVLFLLAPLKAKIVRGVMARCRQRCRDAGVEVRS